jgi:hypothetical protein
MQDRAGRCVAYRQTYEIGRVESVYRRPAAGAFVDVGRDTLVGGDVPQRRDEAVIAVTVDGRGEAYDDGAHAPLGQVHGGPGAGDPRMAAALGRIAFGGHCSGCEPEHARGDEEWSPTSFEDRAHGLDRREVCPGRVLVAGEVVDIGQVDNSVGRFGPGPQARRILEAAAVDARAKPRDRGDVGLCSGQPDHLVSGPEQFGNDRRPDPAGCSGDEDAHDDLRTSDVTL